MKRSEADAQVAPFTRTIDGYSAVTHEDAKRLLGEAGFARLMADAIRRSGPTAETVYPWNVVDYLVMAP